MVVGAHNRKVVEDFLGAIRPLRAAYAQATFSYLAVKTEAGLLLLKGQVSLNNTLVNASLGRFASANVRAGQCALSDIAESLEDFIAIVESGKIPVANETFLFPGAGDAAHSAYFQPFHQIGLQNQNRLDVLGIVGGQNTEVNRTLHLDWEVKASPTPYDGLHELATEYQVGIVRTDAVSIEFAAFNVAAFDLSSSIDGTKARLGLRLAKGAASASAALGYRIISQGKTSGRGLIEGKGFEWSQMPDRQQGWAEIEVPAAAVVHGIASYAGIAQHQGWAIDPGAVQNPLRAAYDSFDKGLVFVNEVLARESKSGSTSRDLETVVGWILWMLGFGVANLGSTSRTQDAPDLLAAAPAGHQMIVEVTTGLLGADKKLTNLHDRAQAVRRALTASGNTHIRVLPVIVTSKTRAEIAPEFEQAEKWGIYVVTREDFESLLTRTLFMPKPDHLFEETEKAVLDARKRHEPPPPDNRLGD